LTRYIHLNPLRTALVRSIDELRRYPWSGHAPIMGTLSRPWQDVDAILSHFGQTRGRARAAYEAFVRTGSGRERRPEMVGGGLIRSAGGWSQVVAMRQRGERSRADERILGGGDFTEKLLKDTEERTRETLRLARRVTDLPSLCRIVAARESVSESELRSGSRAQTVIRARKIVSQLAIGRLRYSGAEVARYLGVTASTVNRAARQATLTDLDKYL
jgi:hypothetical protein